MKAKDYPKKVTLKDQIRKSLLDMEVDVPDMYPVDNKNFVMFYQYYYAERKKLMAEGLGEWTSTRNGHGADEMFLIIRLK